MSTARVVTIGGSDATLDLSSFISSKSSTHNWASGTTAWTLSGSEQQSTILNCTGTPGGGVDVVATPTANKLFILVNATNQTVTLKANGQSGIGVATTKTAILRGNGTDFVRVTGDA